MQVDFVNDISARYKDVLVTDENYLIDNVENILSNKLTAVIGRDNPKDIFDIFLIAKYYSFSWKQILDSAKEKAFFTVEDLVVRLKSFPPGLLKSINIIDEHFLDDFDEVFPVLINEIVEMSHHISKQ